jgi:alpha-L-rhamnosidase
MMIYRRIRSFRLVILSCLVVSAHGLPPTQDPRGPIRVPGIVPTFVDAGVHVAIPAFKSVAAPELKAKWIWVNAGGKQLVAAQFRKPFQLGKVPSTLPTWISADRHYRLYVNGHLIARGPADAGEDYPGGKSQGGTGLTYADQVDLAPFLQVGSNVIAAEVFEQRLCDWYGSSGHPGFFLQNALFNTDESWHGQEAGYWKADQFQAAKEPVGWRLADFQETTWPACIAAGEYWPKLLACVLPTPLEAVYPIKEVVRITGGVTVSNPPFKADQGIKVTGNGSFSLLYDRVQAGYAGIHVKGGEGATLKVEMYEGNSSGGRRKATMVTGVGDQYFETPFYGSFIVLNVTVDNVSKPFEIVDIRSIHTSMPVTYRGEFSCSDDSLNQLWKACRWQDQICMQDHFLDSPDHQEPISDPGDYLIESEINYYAFGMPWLTEQDCRKFGAMLENNNYINFHTSYSLLWLQMMIDYHRYTGNTALLRELTPQVHGLLDKFTGWIGTNGLISEAPDYMFMDWVSIHGIECHHPPAVMGQAYLTAFYYRALADGITIANLMGDAARAAKYQQLRTEIRTAFNRELWNEKEGLYRDGKPFQTHVAPSQWLPADTDVETFSGQANTLAVLYDLVPDQARSRAIMTKVMAEQPAPNMQPYFMHFVFAALDHSGLFEGHFQKQVARWKINPSTQSFREMWDSGDLSHAWGGTPLIQMSGRILGVSPHTPGFDLVSIRPTLGNLKWAKGMIPTPHGQVKVAWKLADDGLKLLLEVSVPAGSRAEVILPTHRFKGPTALCDGKSVPSEKPVRVEAGRHRFEVSGSEQLPVTTD